MKRGIALLLALALLVCGLSGCRRKEDPLASIPNPVATFVLSDGSTMRFELYVQEAPNTVANFVELANSGFYDGLRFFRIVPGVLVQSGDPRNNGTGHADYVIQGEFSENGIENNLSHTRGTISMCRLADYDTASTQFFIMQGSYPEYNGQYAAFGRAMDMDSLSALDAIASTGVDANYLPVGAAPNIERVRVETFGYKYEAAKMNYPGTTKKPEEDDSVEEVPIIDAQGAVVQPEDLEENQ